MLRRIVSVLVVACFPFHAKAQVCIISHTVQSCRLAVANAFADQEAPDEQAENEAIEGDIATAVVTANTGNVEAPANPTPSVTDFNPLLQMAADSGGLGNEDEALTINFNNFIDLPIRDYQAKLILRHARLNESIVTSLRTNGADARITELEDEFDDFDDATLSLSYNPRGRRKGRNPRDHEDLLSQVFADARLRIRDDATRRVVAARVDEDGVVKRIEDELLRRGAPSFDVENTRFAEIDAILMGTGLGTALMVATENTQRLSSERQQLLRSVLQDNEFFTLVDLIDSQPQLFVSVQANAPAELVGPRTMSAKVTWEKGWVNVNGFEQSLPACGSVNADGDAEDETSAPDSPDLLTCLRRYLDQDNNRSTLQHGDRISLSLEYKKIDEYSVVLVDDGIAINAPQDESVVGSFSYGRYLRTRNLGDGKPRIDVAIQYEKVDNNVLRQDRFVTTASFSQKLGNSSILSFGLVYANKPEFRGEVDEELSARLGVNYKIGGPD